MKNKIKEIFNNSGLNIISEEILNEYIDFCYTRRSLSVKGIHVHHILPKSDNLPFKKYEDEDFNKVPLNVEDHYKAHELIARSIDNFYIIYPYICMSNDGRVNL